LGLDLFLLLMVDLNGELFGLPETASIALWLAVAAGLTAIFVALALNNRRWWAAVVVSVLFHAAMLFPAL
jgi:hypothetical protein